MPVVEPLLIQMDSAESSNTQVNPLSFFLFNFFFLHVLHAVVVVFPFTLEVKMQFCLPACKPCKVKSMHP